MLPLHFTSTITRNHREQLERIMFFNPLQRRHQQNIASVIDEFGFPSIVVNGNNLKIVVGTLDDCQTIAAYDGEGDDATLLAVLLFYRRTPEDIIAVHVAVAPECSSTGDYAEEMVVMRLVNKLREDMKRVKGVKRILLAYTGEQNKLASVPVRP